MTTSSKLYRSDNLTVSEEKADSDANNQLFDLFEPDTEVFTRVYPRQKKGRQEGWLENLYSTQEVEKVSQHTRDNWGIALGQQIKSGHTVVFDKEAGGELPEVVQQLLTDHAIAIWESPHGGRNYLLTVSLEALDLLQKYKEKVYITGEEHDLEILKSKHALVPPSEINHADCSDTKPCEGEGVSRYNLKYCGNTRTVDLQTVGRILDPLPVEESNESNTTPESGSRNEAEDFGLEELPEDFDHIEYFNGHIPGNDSYLERLDTMLKVPEIRRLWLGDYQDRSENELKLRSYIAWHFNGDRIMVQYIFENELPNWRSEQLKYAENEYHAKSVLEFEEYVSRPYYTTGISFDLWEQLAREIMNRESVTVNELHGDLLRTDDIEPYEKRTIRKGIEIFEKKDIVNRKSKSVAENKRINEEYLDRLEELIEEFNPTKFVNYE